MRFLVLAACWTLVSCLDPLVDDTVDPSRIFGDPSIAPENAPHVEDNFELADQVETFPESVAYLQAYADNERVWYWNVPGEQHDHIAPLFLIVDADGVSNPSLPIFDVIPGDRGYSNWWRRVIVRRTSAYAGERIWSREAVEAGVRSGILEEPEPTVFVENCPVVRRGITVDVGDGKTAGTKVAWYRNQRVDYIKFQPLEVEPVTEREMPKYPVYVFQRINEGAPIYEFLTGVDMNGDGVLNASNNVFPDAPPGERYSPLWSPTIVRVGPGYPSIDRGEPPLITSEDEIFSDPDLTVLTSSVVAIQPLEDVLVNCPVQEVKGEL